TDENPEVFVLCGFCRPGAVARGKTRKTQQSGGQPLCWQLKSGLSAAFFAPLVYTSLSTDGNILDIIDKID
ncbi:MAG: hypothetical protein ACI4N5_06420, partial [Christensenellales bacterium]